MDKKTIFGVLATLLIVLMVPGYGLWDGLVRQKTAKEGFLASDAQRGVETYIQFCVSCHGPDGQGKVDPQYIGLPLNPIYRNQLGLDELGADVARKTIARGRPGTAMPAWSVEEDGDLKDYHIRDLVTFLTTWEKAEHLLKEALAHRAAAATPIAAPTPTPAVPATPGPAAADPAVARGKALITGQGCGACHTIAGVPGAAGAIGPKLDGIATAAANRKPGLSAAQYIEESIREPAAFTAQGFPAGVMPKLSLSDAQVRDLVAFLLSLK
ncbi:MAG: c-type cytochrome [Chloroflexi bacterium]|nr:c-type cytochrome [Chloroflexota bacterium]